MCGRYGETNEPFSSTGLLKFTLLFVAQGQMPHGTAVLSQAYSSDHLRRSNFEALPISTQDTLAAPACSTHLEQM